MKSQFIIPCMAENTCSDNVYPLPPPDFYQDHVQDFIDILIGTGTNTIGYSGAIDPQALLGFDESAHYVLYDLPTTSPVSYLQCGDKIFKFVITGGVSKRCIEGPQTCYTGAKPIRGIIISHGRVIVMSQTKVFGKLISELQESPVQAGLYPCAIDVLNARIHQ